MITLGTTELFIPGRSLPRGEFEEYSTSLFEAWDARLQAELSVPDYSVSLEAEEGSVTVTATVAAALVALYGGVSKYNSFLSGLETIAKQVRTAGDHLVDRAAVPFTRLNVQPRIHRRSGDLGRIQRLLRRVQRQEISVEEALGEAEKIIGPDAATAPDFMQRLADTLVTLGHHPEQLILPMELPDEVEVLPPAIGDRQRPAVTQRPSSAPQPRFRVEVWRNSRSGKREVRITEL
jgi:hypothetical protein